MTHKTIEELARWAAECAKTPSPKPFVKTLRTVAEPVEFWNWLQDLLFDRSNTTREIAEIIHGEPPWKKHGGSAQYLTVMLRCIRRDFLGVPSLDTGEVALMMHNARRLAAAAKMPAVPEAKAKKVAQEQPAIAAPQLASKLRAVLDLKLTDDTLKRVLKEIVK